MSAEVRILPTTQAVDAAWNRYADLARKVGENPALRIDRAHCEAMMLAWAEWRDLFVAWARK